VTWQNSTDTRNSQLVSILVYRCALAANQPSTCQPLMSTNCVAKQHHYNRYVLKPDWAREPCVNRLWFCVWSMVRRWWPTFSFSKRLKNIFGRFIILSWISHSINYIKLIKLIALHLQSHAVGLHDHGPQKTYPAVAEKCRTYFDAAFWHNEILFTLDIKCLYRPTGPIGSYRLSHLSIFAILNGA